jgi:hypothetical protein
MSSGDASSEISRRAGPQATVRPHAPIAVERVDDLRGVGPAVAAAEEVRDEIGVAGDADLPVAEVEDERVGVAPRDDEREGAQLE